MVSRINQSLSFHASPESFISSRLQQLSISDPDSLPTTPGIVGGRARPVLRASILNRNVHIISSYRLCEAVLNGSVSTNVDAGADHDDDGESGREASQRAAAAALIAIANCSGSEDQAIFAARPAYAQFMSAFFPGPNILLKDGPLHAAHKQRWKQRLHHVPDVSEPMIRSLTIERFVEPLLSATPSSGNNIIDLYDAMKSLAWDLLFGIFLGLNRNEDRPMFARMEELQEDLLRGQFSLFPVSISTPFWSSPRSKGLNAVSSLQGLLARRLRQIDKPADIQTRSSPCPFLQRSPDQESEALSLDDDDFVSHLLVFTSSIANKALASLLTGYLMNLFLWRDGDENTNGSSLADLINSQEDEPTTKRMLESILAETERLSPPVVGVMRRVTQDIVLREAIERGDQHDILDYHIQRGNDAWLYLAGASRDPGVFVNADSFVWDRYMPGDETQSGGYAFGGGSKTCLGRGIARQICLIAAKVILDSGLSFRGSVPDQGVRYWLGWEKNIPLETIAKDLKQLPTQRPRRPVNVEVVLGRRDSCKPRA